MRDHRVKDVPRMPSKAHNVPPGQISFIGVNARKENLITAPSAPWHSNGYASFTPAGKPTSLMMNPFMFKPLKNAIFPFPPLDGPPQRLEGTPSLAERGRRPFKPSIGGQCQVTHNHLESSQSAWIKDLQAIRGVFSRIA
jgi:hypothetical protein